MGPDLAIGGDLGRSEERPSQRHLRRRLASPPLRGPARLEVEGCCSGRNSWARLVSGRPWICFGGANREATRRGVGVGSPGGDRLHCMEGGSGTMWDHVTVTLTLRVNVLPASRAWS
jgi:hypothetical protein